MGRPGEGRLLLRRHDLRPARLHLPRLLFPDLLGLRLRDLRPADADQHPVTDQHPDRHQHLHPVQDLHPVQHPDRADSDPDADPLQHPDPAGGNQYTDLTTGADQHLTTGGDEYAGATDQHPDAERE